MALCLTVLLRCPTIAKNNVETTDSSQSRGRRDCPENMACLSVENSD